MSTNAFLEPNLFDSIIVNGLNWNEGNLKPKVKIFIYNLAVTMDLSKNALVS